ncbi:hypothetical protein [Streptomyces griseoluteus]|uniref:hypothetical protein n=1 Tax=Streptomyces griseoluteus TaxID=29306 RepID=UPI00365E9F04
MDLTVGAPGEDAGDGAVGSLRGSAGDPVTAGALSLGPAATGVATPGSPRFGTALNG